MGTKNKNIDLIKVKLRVDSSVALIF